MTAPVISLRGVHHAYARVPVLRGIDLEVGAHEVVALIGASGCVKSTLLRCINALEPVQSGEVRVLDHDLSDPDVDVDAVRRRIGIVFQSFNLFPHLSVLANVTLAPRRVLGVARSVAETDARELLDRFGLADKADTHPDRLSGGQQQRVAIVRALALRPEVMLFDEITSALDPELVGEVLGLVRELAATGMTMLLATHEMGFAREVADRICFLKDGVICEQGPPGRLLGDPQHPDTQQFLRRVIEARRL